jgi:hypothetical protein
VEELKGPKADPIVDKTKFLEVILPASNKAVDEVIAADAVPNI